jgi:hypothetical protein
VRKVATEMNSVYTWFFGQAGFIAALQTSKFLLREMCLFEDLFESPGWNIARVH